MHSDRSGSRSVPARCTRIAGVATASLIVLTLGMLVLATPAFAGRSSTGKLAFYPCTRCHPVFVGPDGKPTKPLPNGFKKHEITLEVHDILGTGDKACVVCHDDPTRNPGMLKAPDGSLIPITGDVSRVCQRCHFEQYSEWQQGIHGKNAPKCSAAGCHDPHTPSWIYVAALPPFLGAGMEVRAVGSDRQPFTALAAPPLPPAVLTPTWLVIVAGLGALVSATFVSYLVLGRPRR